MKFVAITLTLFQSVAVASLGIRGEQLQDEFNFWTNYVDNIGSFTPSPIPRSTPPPTPQPSPGPTFRLTPQPSPGPTPRPTLSPTGVCGIDSFLNCTAIMDGEEIDCEAIPPEDQPACECENCVREVKFKYTGLVCSPELAASGQCSDRGPNPFVARYRITSCEDSTEVLADGQTQQGDYVTIGAQEGVCLPACMNVDILVPTGDVTQTFEIDSACDGGRGLVLVSNYGAFESIGYSCSDRDTHNCIQGVKYGLKVCNIGSTDEQVYEWSLTLNKEEINLLQDIPPEDIMLEPGDCFYDAYEAEVDRCNELESCADITANVTHPVTGLPPGCSDTEEIKFGWGQPETLPPTPAPR